MHGLVGVGTPWPVRDAAGPPHQYLAPAETSPPVLQEGHPEEPEAEEQVHDRQPQQPEEY